MVFLEVIGSIVITNLFWGYLFSCNCSSHETQDLIDKHNNTSEAK